jgi:hypothetical protein
MELDAKRAVLEGGYQPRMPSNQFRPVMLGPRMYADRLDLFPDQTAPRHPPLERAHTITSSGRKGIDLILRQCEVTLADEVWIVTTFDKPNVSSCVTSTVFNRCKPSRVSSANTRAVYVIHEFGVPHPQIAALRAFCDRMGIPLIEDCAHTVDSRWPDGSLVGSFGDYVLYSLPKIFPVASGGVVFGLRDAPIDREDARTIAGLHQQLPGLWSRLPSFSERRRALLKGAVARLQPQLEVVTEVSQNVTPWYLPLRFARPAAAMRDLGARNIECGLWHGSDIVVLPLHQFLTDEEMDRIVAGALQAAAGVDQDG